MWFTKQIALHLSLALLVLGGGCVPRALPPVAGVTLKPGRFLTAYYAAPGFAAGKAAYELEPFTIEEAKGVAPAAFQSLLQGVMTQAWEANGLKVKPSPGACRVAGTVGRVSIKGAGFRFITGRISAELTVSGTITQDGRIVFAFADRVDLNSPVNPGPPAPKEQEILLRQAARTFVNHLLTELLLQGPPGADAEG